MGSSLRPLAAALLMSACTVDFQEPVESSTAEIVNGTENPGDEAVVALMVQGAQFCTGTLVTKRVVVTAAHCLPPNVQIPSDQIDVFFGPRIDQPGTFIDASVAAPNPSWDEEALGNDVGVLSLAQDAPVDPLPLPSEPFDVQTQIGDRVRVVGYGIIEFEGTGNGIKRAGEMVIDDYDNYTIYLTPGPSATCNGDSGGPLFVDDGAGGEVFAGIHSRSDCDIGSLNERVDVHLDGFIFPALQEYGDPTCELDNMCADGCSAPDPDCPCAGDGLCDGSCEAPQTDPDCEAGCGQNGVCVRECTADPDCGDCTQDGICNEDCPDDPDCGGGNGAQPSSDLQGGCSATSSTGAPAALLFLFLLLLCRPGTRRAPARDA